MTTELDYAIKRLRRAVKASEDYADNSGVQMWSQAVLALIAAEDRHARRVQSGITRLDADH